jgi:transcriptional regulator with XRE-family HTH domain
MASGGRSRKDWYHPRTSRTQEDIDDQGQTLRREGARSRRRAPQRWRRHASASPSLGPARRRRTPGLRREEVAALAGIGVDWYIRLEQGRCVSPSSTTVDALAMTLRLSDVEHAHLRALTRTTERRAFERERVPEALQLLIDELRQPAYVTGRRWDVLCWNRAAEELFAFGRLAEADRNILVHLLLTPSARTMFGAAWAEQASRVVAQFRATHDLWAADPAFIALLARLRAECPEFAGWWRSHEVRGSASGLKVFHRPRKGAQHFSHTSFQSNDDPSLRLIVYTRVDEPAPPPPRSSPAAAKPRAK